MSESETRKIFARFDVPGVFESATTHGSGHINDTFAIACRHGRHVERYLLQRVNHVVFPDVPALMSNVERVCRHLRQRLESEGQSDSDRHSLKLYRTRDGSTFTRSDDGSYWRLFNLISNATGHDVVETPGQAFEAAKAFGRFQSLLADLPGPRLHETIAHFHHTPKRVEAFQVALAKDPAGRAAIAADEIRWLLEHRELADGLIDLQRQGLAFARVVHNDAKLNNVLLDDRTQDAVCVIDLDTVMPGLPLYDFGDLVRTSVSPAAEDEPDLGRVCFRQPVFDALVRGYLSEARSMLTTEEVENLPLAGLVITFTMGTRFLTDFLEGDVYYKTHRPLHNLERCRTQWRLIDLMLENQAAMREIVHAAMS